MEPIKFIRTEIFQCSQTVMAEMAGVSQGTVSHWENGKLSPSQLEMSRIRNEAQRKGIPWNDNWFFEVPQSAAQ
jgi:transcriptional regulator with XRE-family HTH domain